MVLFLCCHVRQDVLRAAGARRFAAQLFGSRVGVGGLVACARLRRLGGLGLRLFCSDGLLSAPTHRVACNQQCPVVCQRPQLILRIPCVDQVLRDGLGLGVAHFRVTPLGQFFLQLLLFGLEVGVVFAVLVCRLLLYKLLALCTYLLKLLLLLSNLLLDAQVRDRVLFQQSGQISLCADKLLIHGVAEGVPLVDVVATFLCDTLALLRCGSG